MNPLCRLATAALVALILATIAVPNAHAVTIDWVTVGDPGNDGQTQNYQTGGTLTFGAVTEAFRIMKFEFTNSQYVAFLNAIDPAGTNPNAVYNSEMGIDAQSGITNTGTTNGSRYAVKPNMGDKPVNYVSWWDAARVSNWLHNGAQTYGSTDDTANAPQNTGAYTIGTAMSGNAVAKNFGALYWLPTENEWYKAAYYNPTLNAGTGGYHVYGNGFNDTPVIVSADEVGVGSAAGTGNFANYARGADWNGQDGNVTTVGTNGGSSFYGAFDMSGNVMEWNDLDGTAGSGRGLRGGRWNSDAFSLSSSLRSTGNPSGGSDQIGFRLASPVPVPEPATYVMAIAGLACGGYLVRRRRKRHAVRSAALLASQPMEATSWSIHRLICQESRRLMVCCAAAVAVTVAAPAQAQTSWNAYDDFYFSPTAAGWGGATSPSASGAAWGYYMGNVNGVDGFPSNIGTYLETSALLETTELYRFSSVNPLNVPGPVRSQSFWDDTGGAGFARYVDNVDWFGGAHSSLGSYSVPWFAGAPGLGDGPGGSNLTNLIWMQSAYLQQGTGEGIASVLTWTAPATRIYDFYGLFVSGNQPTTSAAVAITDSLGGTAPLSRTVLANDAIQSFSFSKAYTAGDVVQFQVGNALSSGNAVGLQVSIVPSRRRFCCSAQGCLGYWRLPGGSERHRYFPLHRRGVLFAGAQWREGIGVAA